MTEHMLKSEYKPSILGITESQKLWIAEVSGPAAGIGSAYMMACDLVVMAKGSYLYQAFAAIGLIPDGGATWQLVSQDMPGLPSNTYVSRIEASNFDEGTAYATFDGHDRNDYRPYVYVSDNYG